MLRLTSTRSEVVDINDLPDETRAIVEAGWLTGPGGALLLRALWHGDPGQVPRQSEVGVYEYHFNDVHIPLSDLINDMGGYLANAAARGLLFARTMLQNAVSLPGSETLMASVGIFADMADEDFLLQGVTVKFFSKRGNYPEWFEDLEGFEREAIALVEMPDAIGDLR